MRFALLIGVAFILTACETWSGFKKDVVTGVDAIEEAI